jgi:accessory gene regulator B
MRRTIKRFARYVSTLNNYNQEQAEIVEYVFLSIFFEVIKVVGIVTIFLLLGYVIPCIIILGVMISTKPFIGGYHEDSQTKCFIASLLIVGALVYLSKTNTLNIISICVIEAFALFAVWHQAPIKDPNMPLTKQDLINLNRKIGLTVFSSWTVISLTLYWVNKGISDAITWTVLIQSVLLFQKRQK